MNKKSIALWNITIIISLVITAFLFYNNYQSYQTTIELWEDFENQEIGTDKILQDKVKKNKNVGSFLSKKHTPKRPGERVLLKTCFFTTGL